MKCLVCPRNATGNYYGAHTCEGCKGFFRRMLESGTEYNCNFGGKCEVTIRAACKACRFRQCLSVGMRKRRIPGRKAVNVLRKSFADNQEGIFALSVSRI
ncbi:hypothetical protein BV898_18617 [Hypsibius exemplaris]|uniref:Nuclear receptor domain-containing protein n=1 Tax=Hypsibius exemplaris TaxID=2072580 RepID=A0A9X6NPG2_HYPEX|nr:hypothetical protein BV898_18617 [Hypsibius exemplaris]